MRRKLVVGNWKRHGSMAANRVLLERLIADLSDLESTDCAVCVPYPYLGQVQSLLQGTRMAWGAQNLSPAHDGAITGAVAADMLVEYGCTHVIVGHSERRQTQHETDDTAAARFQTALKAGLCPVLCIGESAEERESGWTEYIVGRQLDSILHRFGPQALQQAVLAYEPVWAIGGSKAATPQQAQDVHAFIRNRIARCDAEVAAGIRILYGGSVTQDNALALFAMPDVDGGLIGRASLTAETFVPICQAAERAVRL